MLGNDEKYYLILESIVGKEENGHFFIFQGGEWVPDAESLIMDRLVGYDSSEPPGSPYGYGSTSIMDEIEEISSERAKILIGKLSN